MRLLRTPAGCTLSSTKSSNAFELKHIKVRLLQARAAIPLPQLGGNLPVYYDYIKFTRLRPGIYSARIAFILWRYYRRIPEHTDCFLSHGAAEEAGRPHCTQLAKRAPLLDVAGQRTDQRMRPPHACRSESAT